MYYLYILLMINICVIEIIIKFNKNIKILKVFFIIKNNNFYFNILFFNINFIIN